VSTVIESSCTYALGLKILPPFLWIAIIYWSCSNGVFLNIFHFIHQIMNVRRLIQISVINSCWEKCDEKCAYMFNVNKKQLSRQTGSSNLTGPKTLPTIWYTYIHQIMNVRRLITYLFYSIYYVEIQLHIVSKI
jgi:hypothetical protein